VWGILFIGLNLKHQGGKMSKGNDGSQMTEEIALDAKFKWTLGLLSGFLNVTKKDLRKAKRIIDTPKFKDRIVVNGKMEKRVFDFGYQSFHLLIKNKRRHILAPHPALQKVFRVINEKIIELYPAHKKAYGFVRKRNFQMATRSLVGNEHFFSFDISDAFPSITSEIAEKTLLDLKVPEELVKPLARLVTHQYQGYYRLPQGASSSPAILNMVYKPMCEEIEAVCQKFGIKWCVYVDDFTFAGEVITSEMREALIAIPRKYGFRIKKSKTKDNLGKTIPHMLGLTIVDDQIQLRRRTKREFRRRFYLAWKYDTFNEWEIAGIVAVIKQTYGKDIENWPNSLKNSWLLYTERDKRREDHDKKR
jgi:hypothetical protein